MKRLQDTAIFLRMTSAEKKKISSAAKKAGLSTTAFVRVVLTAHLEAKKHVEVIP